MTKLYKRDCGKCHGTGYLPHHSNVMGGKCFKCNGTGYFAVKTDPAILDARNAKAAEKREAKREQRAAEYRKRNFWRNIAKGIRKAVWEAERQAEHEAAEAIVNGKQVITGAVISVKEQHGQWGWTVKMLVKDDRGFKVWGSVPSAILDIPEVTCDTLGGQRVTFSATVEASQDDEKFGFFKRPTKAALAA